MSKKKWLFVFIVAAFLIYLGIGKFFPDWGYGIDKVLGGSVGKVKAGIEASPVWQQYDIWFSAAFFSVITALIVYRGRDVYDSIRGIARVQATSASTGYQTTPTAQPVIIPTTPTVVSTTPTVVAEPPKEEAKA